MICELLPPKGCECRLCSLLRRTLEMASSTGRFPSGLLSPPSQVLASCFVRSPNLGQRRLRVSWWRFPGQSTHVCYFAVFIDAGDDAPSQRNLTRVSASVATKGR